MTSLKDLLPAAKSSTNDHSNDPWFNRFTEKSSSIISFKQVSTTNTHYDHTNDPWFKNRFTEKSSSSISFKQVPVYRKLQGFRPKNPEDFGDGGAFPEIHIAQYPLSMGRNKSNKPGAKKTLLPVTVDAEGNVVFDAIVRQNENSKKIVYSQHKDIIPKILKNEGYLNTVVDEDEELQKEIQETKEETKAAIEKVVNVRLSAAQPSNVARQSGDSEYITYKPSQQSAAFSSGAKERIIRMVELPVDPLEPPKFNHKRVPKASGSPPVPVMHSPPPRPVTVKDQQDWKIPPCVSNWKNPKGYTIPLDKRLAADGRGLQDVQINDNFAKLSEAIYVGEQKVREAVSMRSKVQKEMMMKEKEREEQELRALAQKARSERTGAGASMPVASDRGRSESVDPRGDYDSYDRERERERERDREGPKESREEREKRIQSEKIREERRRERERERRLAAMGKKRSKITRDRDRDISEKVALGMASTGVRGGEVMYDQRLFNQEKGMDSGFATDDQYNVYDKGLFTAQPTLSTLYKPKKDNDEEMYGNADDQLDKIKNTERFKPDKAFTGASERAGSKRERPVEFEKEDEQDLFGLDRWVSDLKKAKKPLDKIGSGGTMRASGGGSSSRDDYGGSGRTKINFERSGR